MATQLQSRRGTTAQMNAFTGAEGEIAVNTSTDTLHVHDGSTAGGHALAKADGSNIATYAGSFTTISASGAITGNVTGNLTGNVTGNVTGDVTGDLTGSVLTAAQTNITSVGTLSALTVSGDLTVDTDTLVVDATNNRVGIGTSSPDTRVQIKGGVNSSQLILGGTDNRGLKISTTAVGGQNDSGIIFDAQDTEAGGANSTLIFSTGGSETMRISGGSVAIGGNPIGGARLGLSKSAGGDVFILTDTSSADLIVNCTSGVTRMSPSTGTLALGTGNAEKLRIDSSGRLLVNTASVLNGSAAKLQVLQTVSANWTQRINNSTGSPYGLAIDYTSANPNGTANHFIYCSSTTGAKFGVYSNGGVLNYSGNNVNLSDRNAKKDITIHTDNEWNCVKAWEIVDYRYKDEADDSPVKIGVIAQQIQEHCPDLVNVFQEQADAVEEVLGEDGEVVTEAKAAVEERIGVNEAQMMWKVTKALQEAMERIETLEAKVQTLENT